MTIVVAKTVRIIKMYERNAVFRPAQNFRRAGVDAKIAVQAAGGKIFRAAGAGGQKRAFGFGRQIFHKQTARPGCRGKQNDCSAGNKQPAAPRAEHRHGDRRFFFFPAERQTVPRTGGKAAQASDAGFVIHFFIFEIDAAGRTAGSTGAAGNSTIFVKAYPVDTAAGEKPEQRARRTDVGAEITPLKPHQNGKQCQQNNRKPGA